MKKPTNSASTSAKTSFISRQNKWKEEKEQRLKHKKVMKEVEEKQTCTFQPNTSRSRSKPRKKSPRMRSLNSTNEPKPTSSNYNSNNEAVNVMIMEDFSSSPKKYSGTPQDLYYY